MGQRSNGLFDPIDDGSDRFVTERRTGAVIRTARPRSRPSPRCQAIGPSRALPSQLVATGIRYAVNTGNRLLRCRFQC
jgi:hypothetical protein